MIVWKGSTDEEERTREERQVGGGEEGDAMVPLEPWDPDQDGRSGSSGGSGLSGQYNVDDVTWEDEHTRDKEAIRMIGEGRRGEAAGEEGGGREVTLIMGPMEGGVGESGANEGPMEDGDSCTSIYGSYDVVEKEEDLGGGEGVEKNTITLIERTVAKTDNEWEDRDSTEGSCEVTLRRNYEAGKTEKKEEAAAQRGRMEDGRRKWRERRGRGVVEVRMEEDIVVCTSYQPMEEDERGMERGGSEGEIEETQIKGLGEEQTNNYREGPTILITAAQGRDEEEERRVGGGGGRPMPITPSIILETSSGISIGLPDFSIGLPDFSIGLPDFSIGLPDFNENSRRGGLVGGDSHSLSAHLAAHPRPPTPKSPITVDEWVAALPHPTSVEDESDVWTSSDPGLEDATAEDLLNLGAEAGHLVGPGLLVTAASEDGSKASCDAMSSSGPPVASKMADTHGGCSTSPSRLQMTPVSTRHTRTGPNTSPTLTPSTRPLTLADVTNTLHQRQGGLLERSDSLGVEGRRSQFASLRDKQPSFQSEFSGLSYQSKSSIDSLLEARESDPVDVLLNLGFGGQAQDQVSRIPKRFLRPSQVPGNNIEEFLKSEDEFSDMMETAEWMPGLDPQAIRRSSVATVSPLMSRLLETIRDARSRLNSTPDSTSVGQSSGGNRFAAVAKSLAMKKSVMQTLSASSSGSRPNKLTVLNAENRRLLDLQGQKSPEVPRKRLIIGKSSFDLGRDGELIARRDERTSPTQDKNEKENEELQEAKDEEESSKEEREASRDDFWRNGHERLTHKESVWSMASSITSVDSSEEEIREQRHRLQLSLSRRPLHSESMSAPTTPADSIDSPQPVINSEAPESLQRFRQMMRRMSRNKRYSTVSSGGSWDMDDRIPEEDDRIPEEDHEEEEEPGQPQDQSEVDSGSGYSSMGVKGQQGTGTLQNTTKNDCVSPNLVQDLLGGPQGGHSRTPDGGHSRTPDGGHSRTPDGSHSRTPDGVHSRTPDGGHSRTPDKLEDCPLDDSVTLPSFSPMSSSPALVQPIPMSPAKSPWHSTPRLGTALRRQERVDDEGVTTHMLLPPKVPAVHTCRHQHSHGHQGRTSSGEEERGVLCRSGSAQSDSSGFMDGDAGEMDPRSPTQPLSSTPAISNLPPQPVGHSWWWSHESGGSVETVRHAPLSRSPAFRPHPHPFTSPSWEMSGDDLTSSHDPSHTLAPMADYPPSDPPLYHEHQGNPQHNHRTLGHYPTTPRHLSRTYPTCSPVPTAVMSTPPPPHPNNPLGIPTHPTSTPNHSVSFDHGSRGHPQTYRRRRSLPEPLHPQDQSPEFSIPPYSPYTSPGLVVPSLGPTAAGEALSTATTRNGTETNTDLVVGALQSYRRQLSRQEHLSRDLHASALDLSASPATSHQVWHQLRSISAIRGAIRAEVTHMEQLLAPPYHHTLSAPCVNLVLAQMVHLLQQQSDLCHDLESLTLASSQSSKPGVPSAVPLTLHNGTTGQSSTTSVSSSQVDGVGSDAATEMEVSRLSPSAGDQMVHGRLDSTHNCYLEAKHSPCNSHLISYKSRTSVTPKSSTECPVVASDNINLSDHQVQCSGIPRQCDDDQPIRTWLKYEPTTFNQELNNNSIDSCTELEGFCQGTREPNRGHPVTQEPNRVHPVTQELNRVHPVTREPNSVHPVTREPNSVHPVNREPNSVHPVNREPSIEDPMTLEPSIGHPGRSSFRRWTSEPVRNGVEGVECCEGGPGGARGWGRAATVDETLSQELSRLVQQQVDSHTTSLEEQLHQQTKDMADLKSMMQVLLSKLA